VKGFADETYIDVASGNGGNGCVSFRREKYVPRGGPDGGDGGSGGSVVFEVRQNLRTLAHLKTKRAHRAGNGEPGAGRRRHGGDGADAVIPVPPGTLIRDVTTGTVLKDMTDVDRWVFLEGGKGGKGNYHYRTSTRQAPRYAQEGRPGKSVRLHVELNVIADIGFVGFPNAGKSTLLSVLTNAQPKIGAYAFTTTTPNVGVMQIGEARVVLADIPGLIEGAAEGAGMGIRFLKHIARTAGLAFCIDLTDPDPEHTFAVLLRETGAFSRELSQKPRIIVGTKLDLPDTGGAARRLREALPKERILPVSAHTHDGLSIVSREFLRLAAGDIDDEDETGDA
jgi:GTPase